MNSGTDRKGSIDRLFKLYANDVFRYARLALGDQDEAKDVVQEVFFRAFRSWESFRRDSTAKTWLLSIARHYIVDLLRKRTRERKLHSDEMPAMRSSTMPVETFMVLEESLLKLKSNYRQVFVLRHIEQLSIHETAQTLGWSEGKVRTTDSRAIHMLRELLIADDKEVMKNDIGS